MIEAFVELAAMVSLMVLFVAVILPLTAKLHNAVDRMLN
jgi:hypothetical protein